MAFCLQAFFFYYVGSEPADKWTIPESYYSDDLTYTNIHKSLHSSLLCFFDLKPNLGEERVARLKGSEWQKVEKTFFWPEKAAIFDYEYFKVTVNPPPPLPPHFPPPPPLSDHLYCQ